MLVSHKDAQKIDGVSRATRERLVKAGEYPEPVQITPGRIGFVKSEVEDWVRARIAERDAKREQGPRNGLPHKRVDHPSPSATQVEQPALGCASNRRGGEAVPATEATGPPGHARRCQPARGLEGGR